MLVWSYHWWFGYPFPTLPMQEWVHYNPWCASRYRCSHHIEKWNSHTERSFFVFPSPHTKTNGYCFHQRIFLNPSICFHCWSNSSKFGVTCFDDNNTCNDNCHSKQGTILHKTNARKWFHPPCHRYLQLSSSLFWFLSDFLCTCMYNLPSIDLLGTFNTYNSL
jgi:hypothetical protein